jgi:hypothetical protein
MRCDGKRLYAAQTPRRGQMKRIPISAVKRIAADYGYDQVIVYARKVGESPDPHGEHITTYGISKAHCEAAAKISAHLQRVMGWDAETDSAS